jgi:hypothetical protein
MSKSKTSPKCFGCETVAFLEMCPICERFFCRACFVFNVCAECEDGDEDDFNEDDFADEVPR